MFPKIIRNILISNKKLFFYDFKAYSINAREINSTNFETLEDDTEEKVLKVAIIGTPNAGKSTLINNIMDRKVCATSSKVHTTRTKAKAIFTEGTSQIIFVDTPGLVNLKEAKRFNLEKSFIKDCKSTIQQADIIGVIHDVSNIYTRERLDLKIIKLLEYHKKKPSFLVLNKVDVLKSKRKLLDMTRMLTENCLKGKSVSNVKPIKEDEENEDKSWPHFQEVFMVSALTGNGLLEVKNYLIKKALPGKWLYPDNIWSDQTAEDIIVNTVKAKFLDFLQQEIPYQLLPEIEYFKLNDEGIITTVVLVKCPSSRIAKLTAGVNDGRLRQIVESVQRDLQNAFQNFVRINIILQGPDNEK